jgi:hypothetical protein
VVDGVNNAGAVPWPNRGETGVTVGDGEGDTPAILIRHVREAGRCTVWSCRKETYGAIHTCDFDTPRARGRALYCLELSQRDARRTPIRSRRYSK